MFNEGTFREILPTSYLLKRSLIKNICSWRDKPIVLKNFGWPEQYEKRPYLELLSPNVGKCGPEYFYAVLKTVYLLSHTNLLKIKFLHKTGKFILAHGLNSEPL